ncbi:MAG: zinc ABC transporter substrate-binding protein, partial [Chlamydiia bacterium]|nr:zinc ABC transporter substrate-binding protein [Chlamydiia bacterium]
MGLLALISCSQRNDKLKNWMRDNSKIKVLATTAQIGDLVQEIGGDRADVWVLIQGELDPHSYELVKGDDEKLARSRLIFYNGLGLEHGASLASTLRGSDHALAVGEKIAAQVPEAILKRGAATDPHLWMDISLWKQAVGPIVASLSEADPDGAYYYQERGKEVANRMQDTHEAILEIFQKIPKEKKYLVTSHDAFQYFARAYLTGATAPEGLAPDGQLSPLDLKRMIDFLKNHEIEVLFSESN